MRTSYLSVGWICFGTRMYVSSKKKNGFCTWLNGKEGYMYFKEKGEQGFL